MVRTAAPLDASRAAHSRLGRRLRPPLEVAAAGPQPADRCAGRPASLPPASIEELLRDMRDGLYHSCVSVDGRSAYGLLTLADNAGRGSDGRRQFEVHVSGNGHAMRGVVNLLTDPESALRERLPHHYSLAVTGSGGDDGFNLIGYGPGGVVVEIDAAWTPRAGASGR